jgi:hypothetical protein
MSLIVFHGILTNRTALTNAGALSLKDGLSVVLDKRSGEGEVLGSASG